MLNSDNTTMQSTDFQCLYMQTSPIFNDDDDDVTLVTGSLLCGCELNVLHMKDYKQTDKSLFVSQNQPSINSTAS